MSGVLVTGAGLLGVAVSRQCARYGPVTLIDARPVDPLLQRHLPPATLLHPLDVRDEGAMTAVLRASAPDYVVHTAALLGSRAEKARRLTWAVNVGGTVATYRAARAAGVSRFLLASSLAVYGAGVVEGPDERARAAPRSVYGRSKLAAEQAVAAEAQHGPPVTILRLTGLYGLPSRARGGSLAQRLQRLLEESLRLRRARVPAALALPREYLHVTDAARAAVALLALSTDGTTVFNAGSGQVAGGQRLGRAVALAIPGCDVAVGARPPTGVRLRPLDCRRLASVTELPAPLSLEEGVDGLVRATAAKVNEPCG